MATAELTPATPRQLGRTWLAAYAGIWGATLGVALTVAVIPPLEPAVRHLLRLRLQANQTPAPRPGHVIALAAHNLPIASWPQLLDAAGARRSDFARRAADTTLVACLAANVAPVGAALGAYGIPLLPYLPQLPLEWAALSLGASAWLLCRHRVPTVVRGLVMLALTTAVLIGAATVETFAVPHENHGAAIDIQRPAISGGVSTAVRSTHQ